MTLVVAVVALLVGCSNPGQRTARRQLGQFDIRSPLSIEVSGDSGAYGAAGHIVVPEGVSPLDLIGVPPVWTPASSEGPLEDPRLLELWSAVIEDQQCTATLTALGPDEDVVPYPRSTTSEVRLGVGCGS